MPDPTTPNLGLFIPLNGADVGTWDIPMNANFSLLDNIFGASANVALSNVPVTLSPAQYNTSLITLTGTLSANIFITLPPVGRVYTFYNTCANNVTFYVLVGTAAGTVYAGLPPYQISQVVCNGTDTRHMGLPHVGTYLDIGFGTVPNWISNSVPQPYLNCDGTAFSSATYPALRDYLGSAVLPDARGRFRAAMNQGTARLPAYADTLSLAGGSQTISQANIPSYNLTVTDPGHLHGVTLNTPAGYSWISAIGGGGLSNFNFAGADTAIATTVTVNSNFTGISVNSAGSGTAYSPPGYAGGLTLIRAG